MGKRHDGKLSRVVWEKAGIMEKNSDARPFHDLSTNEIQEYTSINKAAKAMGVTQPPLSNRLKETQGSIIVKKRFVVEKVKSK
jgi:DNA-binding Lrp family transcriptional regulator